MKPRRNLAMTPKIVFQQPANTEVPYCMSAIGHFHYDSAVIPIKGPQQLLHQNHFVGLGEGTGGQCIEIHAAGISRCIKRSAVTSGIHF